MRDTLLAIYREQMSPLVDPCDVTLIRWCERIEVMAEFNVNRRGWSIDQAADLVASVQLALVWWRLEMPTWVVEQPCHDGTELTRHVKAPTYEQALQLWD